MPRYPLFGRYLEMMVCSWVMSYNESTTRFVTRSSRAINVWGVLSHLNWGDTFSEEIDTGCRHSLPKVGRGCHHLPTTIFTIGEAAWSTCGNSHEEKEKEKKEKERFHLSLHQTILLPYNSFLDFGFPGLWASWILSFPDFELPGFWSSRVLSFQISSSRFFSFPDFDFPNKSYLWVVPGVPGQLMFILRKWPNNSHL